MKQSQAKKNIKTIFNSLNCANYTTESKNFFEDLKKEVNKNSKCSCSDIFEEVYCFIKIPANKTQVYFKLKCRDSGIGMLFV